MSPDQRPIRFQQHMPKTLLPRGHPRQARSPDHRSSSPQDRLTRQRLDKSQSRSPSPDRLRAQSQSPAQSLRFSGDRGNSPANSGSNGGSQSPSQGRASSQIHGDGKQSRSPSQEFNRFPSPGPYIERPVQIHTSVHGPAVITAHFGKELERTSERTVRVGQRLDKTWSDPYVAEVAIEGKGLESKAHSWITGGRRASARGLLSDHKFRLGTGVGEEVRPSDVKIKAQAQSLLSSRTYLRVSTRLNDHPAALNSESHGQGLTILRGSNSRAQTESRGSSISNSSPEPQRESP